MSPITSDEEDDGSDTGLSSGDGRECTDDDDDDDDDHAAAPSSASAPPNTTPTLPHGITSLIISSLNVYNYNNIF